MKIYDFGYDDPFWNGFFTGAFYAVGTLSVSFVFAIIFHLLMG